MQLIQPYILGKLDEGITSVDLQHLLGVGASMISAYKKGDYNPSLEVAIRVYVGDGVVLHPFSEESLNYEMKKA